MAGRRARQEAAGRRRGRRARQRRARQDLTVFIQVDGRQEAGKAGGGGEAGGPGRGGPGRSNSFYTSRWQRARPEAEARQEGQAEEDQA